MTINKKALLGIAGLTLIVVAAGLILWKKGAETRRRETERKYSVNAVISGLVNINEIKKFVQATPGTLEFINAYWEVHIPQASGEPVRLDDLKKILAKIAPAETGVPPIFDEFFEHISGDKEALATVNKLLNANYSPEEIRKFDFEKRREIFMSVANIDVGATGSAKSATFSLDKFKEQLKNAALALAHARSDENALAESARSWGVSKRELVMGSLTPEAARKIFEQANSAN